MADINGGAFTPNGKTVALTKTVLDENPILINKVIVSGSRKIGYLMYNAFYSNYDSQLNTAFETLKSQGITDLALDLRYNGGGSIQTSTRLASMTTSVFTGQVFAKEQWNAKIESYFEANDPESLKNLFVDKTGTTPINSLNMTKIYILTSASTASASELAINRLKPHITVVLIGDVTVGKNVGSVTLYDSPTFGKREKKSKPSLYHTASCLKNCQFARLWRLYGGLEPTYSLKETSALFILGSSTEPLLSLVIAKITGKGKTKQSTPGMQFDYFKDSKSANNLQNQMYLDKTPEDLLKALE